MGRAHLTLALAGVLAIGAGPALARDRCELAAQPNTVRDGHGRIVGTINGSAADATFRDDRGRVVATSSTSSTGLTTYRDGSGRVIGTRDVTGSGEVVYRDGNGRIVDRPPPPLEAFCPPD